MNQEVFRYIAQTGWAEIPFLQQKFNLSYKEVKAVIDELVKDGQLKYQSGIRYVYTKSTPRPRDPLVQRFSDEVPYRERMRNPFGKFLDPWKHKIGDDDDDKEYSDDDDDDLSMDDDNDDDNDIFSDISVEDLDDDLHIKNKFATFEEDLERYRLRYLNENTSDSKDEPIKQSPDFTEDLCFAALEICLKRGFFATSLLQRTLHISYNKAGRILEWLEKNGYVSDAYEGRVRKVLITEEEFKKIFQNRSAGTESSDGATDSKDLNQTDAPKTADAECEAIKAADLQIDSPLTSEDDLLPEHPSWSDDNFILTLHETTAKLIRLNPKLNLAETIKMVENRISVAKSAKDKRNAELYEGVLHDLKRHTEDSFLRMKASILCD